MVVVKKERKNKEAVDDGMGSKMNVTCVVICSVLLVHQNRQFAFLQPHSPYINLLLYQSTQMW